MTQTEHANLQDTGCGRQIAWIFAGFVLPFYSLEYYIGAIRRPLRSAFLFFTLLMTLAAMLTTARLGQMLDVFRQQIHQAYQAGELPVVTIQDGVASVEGEDPFLLEDHTRYFVAVDTTGALDRESLNKYEGGVLITKTQLFTYNAQRYQSIDLRTYNTYFNLNPIVIDSLSVDQFFGTISFFYLIVVGLVIWFWNVFVWMVFLLATAYFMHSPIQQLLPQFSFQAVLTIGIYAHLPAFTINHILSLFGVRPLLMYTFLLLIFWGGGLYLVVRQAAGEILSAAGELPKEHAPIQINAHPPKLWPAWLGLPIVGFISANAVYNWDFAPMYVLAGTAATIGMLLFIDARQHPESQKQVENKQ